MRCFGTNSGNKSIFLKFLGLFRYIAFDYLLLKNERWLAQGWNPKTMAHGKGLSPDEIANLLGEISENGSDGVVSCLALI
ncbi:hypothetical protein TNCV_2498211 [Trichonephila clavipes]|nr:hypothetical protein TNCV_2498211 [Trichonephila clavipes]